MEKSLVAKKAYSKMQKLVNVGGSGMFGSFVKRRRAEQAQRNTNRVQIRYLQNRFYKTEYEFSKHSKSTTFLEDATFQHRIILQQPKLFGNSWALVTISKDVLGQKWNIRIYIPKTSRTISCKISPSDFESCSSEFIMNCLTSKFTHIYENNLFKPFTNFADMQARARQPGRLLEATMESLALATGNRLIQNANPENKLKPLLRRLKGNFMANRLMESASVKLNSVKKIIKINKFFELTTELDNSFSMHVSSPREERLLRFLEIEIWLRMIRVAHFRMSHVKVDIYLHFGGAKLETKELVLQDQYRISETNEFTTEIFIDLIKSYYNPSKNNKALLKDSNPSNSSSINSNSNNYNNNNNDDTTQQKKEFTNTNNALVDHYFNSMEYIPYEQTSRIRFQLVNYSIQMNETKTFTISLREVLNLYVAEGFSKLQTGYTNSKVTYRDLKEVCAFIIFKIKTQNFLDLAINDTSGKGNKKSSKTISKSSKKSTQNPNNNNNTNNPVALTTKQQPSQFSHQQQQLSLSKFNSNSSSSSQTSASLTSAANTNRRKSIMNSIMSNSKNQAFFEKNNAQNQITKAISGRRSLFAPSILGISNIHQASSIHHQSNIDRNSRNFSNEVTLNEDSAEETQAEELNLQHQQSSQQEGSMKSSMTQSIRQSVQRNGQLDQQQQVRKMVNFSLSNSSQKFKRAESMQSQSSPTNMTSPSNAQHSQQNRITATNSAYANSDNKYLNNSTNAGNVLAAVSSPKTPSFFVQQQQQYQQGSFRGSTFSSQFQVFARSNNNSNASLTQSQQLVPTLPIAPMLLSQYSSSQKSGGSRQDSRNRSTQEEALEESPASSATSSSSLESSDGSMQQIAYIQNIIVDAKNRIIMRTWFNIDDSTFIVKLFQCGTAATLTRSLHFNYFAKKNRFFKEYLSAEMYDEIVKRAAITIKKKMYSYFCIQYQITPVQSKSTRKFTKNQSID